MDSGRTSRSRVLYGSRSSSLSLLVTSLVCRVTKKSLSAMSALVYANKRGVTEARSCVNGNAPLLHISLSKRMINGASFRRRVINEAPVLTSHHVYPRWPVGTDSKGILNYGWLQSMLNIDATTVNVHCLNEQTFPLISLLEEVGRDTPHRFQWAWNMLSKPTFWTTFSHTCNRRPFFISEIFTKIFD